MYAARHGRFGVCRLAMLGNGKGQQAKDQASCRGEITGCPLMDKDFFLNAALKRGNTCNHSSPPVSALGARPGAIPGNKLLAISYNSDFFQAKVLRNRNLLSRLTITFCGLIGFSQPIHSDFKNLKVAALGFLSFWRLVFLTYPIFYFLLQNAVGV